MSGKQVLRYLTSTVGLITVRHRDRVNVMAAEWTFMVAWDPLHIAVSVQKTNYTHDLLLNLDEFAVTFCDASLAAVADWCGSFSGLDVDKTTNELVGLTEPHRLSTPHVTGGVLNAECEIRQVVDLPGYTMFIGEALWYQTDDRKNADPLVKHGRMYHLGEELKGLQVCATSRAEAGGAVTVFATAHGASEPDDWQVQVRDASGILLLDERFPADGDLEQRLDIPHTAVGQYPLKIQVHRRNCLSGQASVVSPQSCLRPGSGRTSKRR